MSYLILFCLIHIHMITEHDIVSRKYEFYLLVLIVSQNHSLWRDTSAIKFRCRIPEQPCYIFSKDITNQ